MFDGLGNSWTFVVFTVCNFVGVIAHQLLLKDTTGLSKEELEQLYQSKDYIEKRIEAK